MSQREEPSGRKSPAEFAGAGLTAFVAFLQVAVTRLHGRPLAVVVDAVAGSAALLDTSTAGHRAGGPLRPR